MRELPEELEAEIVKLVGALAAAFPSAEVGGETLSVFASMLADIPLDLLDVAVEQCIAECRFFPAVAELREKALALSSPAGQRPTSAEAWGAVIAAIRSVGSYRQPTFEDVLVEQAVEIMGWRELCSSENGVADRAHFVRIYEQLGAREMEDARLLPRARKLRALTTGLARRGRLPDKVWNRAAADKAVRFSTSGFRS